MCHVGSTLPARSPTTLTLYNSVPTPHMSMFRYNPRLFVPPLLFLESDSGTGTDDEVYLILALVVVVITLMVVVFIFAVLSIFCLRYQREKAKVTSIEVNHFSCPPCTLKHEQSDYHTKSSTNQTNLYYV